jgi:hypothetical protein
LGTLDGSDLRYSARLSTLMSIRVPEDLTARERWIASKRIGRLDMDFIHDLHYRLFAAYARLGFNDHSWFPDADLDQLISAGEKEIADLQSDLSKAELSLQDAAVSGRTGGEQQRREEIRSKKQLLAERKNDLSPYLAERERRALTTKGR